VADIRASTPSAAAEMVVEKEQSFLDLIETLEKRMIHHQKYFLKEEAQKVLKLIHHRAFQNFKLRLMNLHQRIDGLETNARTVLRRTQQRIAENRAQVTLLQEKIGSSLRRTLQLRMSRWERLSVQLHNLSPLNILKKGYTLCWRDGGKTLVRRIEDVAEEDKLTVSFFKGEFSCLVKDVDKAKPIQSRVVKEES
jgi:exodeoxyribonuclease VII large subunit